MFSLGLVPKNSSRVERQPGSLQYEALLEQARAGETLP
jgi:hypothetical protein